MQTHDNKDAQAQEWLSSLKLKANDMARDLKSTITAGKPGEQPLREWESNGVTVRELPPDEHGILRISIGGGATPVHVNYCVFRGNHRACVELLKAALSALQTDPGGDSQ